MTHRIFFTSIIATSLILFGAGLETGLGADSLHNAPRQRQVGTERHGDYLFSTAKAKSEVIGGRVDKADELARKKSLARAMQQLHLMIVCPDLAGGLPLDGQLRLNEVLTGLLPDIHLQGVEVVDQWRKGEDHFSTISVPLAGMRDISCPFADITDVIDAYLESEQTSIDGLAFCLGHTPRYSKTAAIIRARIAQNYGARKLDIISRLFTPELAATFSAGRMDLLAVPYYRARADIPLKSAELHAKTGNWQEAFEEVRHALEFAPNYGRAHFLLADYFLTERIEPALALAAAEKALRDGTNPQEGLKLQVECLEKMNSPEAEVWQYLLADSKKGAFGYPPEWERELELLVNLKIASMVIAGSGQAVEGEDSPPDPEFKKAVALFQQSKNDDDILRSLALLLSACEKQPFSAKTYNLIGSCYRHLGKPAVALPFLLQALKLKPEYDFALTNLGLCCQSLGLMEAARYYFEYDAVKKSTNGWVQDSYAKFVETKLSD